MTENCAFAAFASKLHNITFYNVRFNVKSNVKWNFFNGIKHLNNLKAQIEIEGVLLIRHNFFFAVLHFIKHSVCYRCIVFYCVFISRLPASSWTGRATGPKDQLEKQMD